MHRTHWLPLLLAVGAVSAGAAGCVPTLEPDRLPDAMEFDPNASPPRSPEPNSVVVNPETGLIDFGVLGVDVPEEPGGCLLQSALPVAQCEFYQYLQRLDGFPTVSPAKAPATAALALPTVTVPDNLFVLDTTGGQIVTQLTVGFDGATGHLTLEREGGWDLGHLYLAAVRGYADGVRTVDDNEVVASSAYYLLKQEESLVTCRPDPQDQPVEAEPVDETCKYFRLLAQSYGAEAAAGQVVALEQIRRAYLEAGVWDVVELLGGMTRDEVAVVWTFPVHTASVAELNPVTGAVPEVVDARTLRVKVKGAVTPTSVHAFSATGNPDGTVFLLNLTALAAGDMGAGMPAFTASWAAPHVVLEAVAPLTPGDQYGVILAVQAGPGMRHTGITGGADSAPLAPSPLTVFLRSQGELVDAEGHSQVSSIGDADAQQLEVGRLQLAALLDNDLFMTLAKLTRENIAFLYGFTFEGL